MLPELTACVALLALTGYVVLGGADFGAGFWDLTAGGAERGAPVRAMIKRAMSPVWEANHVWLIFLLVVLWTGFPEAFGSITSTLAIPLFVAALGIVLRGGAFALKGEAATIAEARALGATFALASVIVPFFLGAAVGAIAAGEVPVGNAAGDEWSSWTGSTSIMVGLLAVATGAHLAAVFLGADARRAGETGARATRSGAGRSARASSPARWRSSACWSCARTHARCSTTSPPAPGWPASCSRRPRGWSRSGSSGASASSSRATRRRRPSPRSWRAGRSPSSPTCCRPT